MKPKRRLGIAYHSPLDVLTLVPNETSVTLKPGESANVFFTQETNEDCEARVQIVFTSPRLLVSSGIDIIDQGSRGQIVNLNTLDWQKILK